MKARIKGVGVWKRYGGLEICSKKDFLEWTLGRSTYRTLFRAWMKSCKEPRLTPSIDRIDTKLGYTLDNMQWLEFGLNCQKACFEHRRKTIGLYRGVYLDRKGRAKPWRAYISKDRKPMLIGSFITQEEAARAYDKWARMIYGRTINFPD